MCTKYDLKDPAGQLGEVIRANTVPGIDLIDRRENPVEYNPFGHSFHIGTTSNGMSFSEESASRWQCDSCPMLITSDPDIDLRESDQFKCGCGGSWMPNNA